MNTYIRRLLLAACIAGSTLPVQAGWASDIGSYVSSTFSGWFSRPSDRTTACMAALGAAAVGLSAYLIYTLWKKQNGALRPQNPDPRPDNPQPPVIVVEPVEPAPEPMPIVETGNAVVMPVARVGRIASLTPAEQHEIQRGQVPHPVAYQSRIGQPVPKESRAVVSCPGPQPYLSWYDLEKQKKKPQVPVTTSQDNPALQAETKRSAAAHDLTASQEWTHVSADDVLPESPKDLVVEQEKDLIERGRDIKHKICVGEKNDLTLDELRALMWYICDTSVPKDKSELTIKVEDTPDRRLYNALRNCKNEQGVSAVYQRASSHFGEQIEGGYHYGIRDVYGLPHLLHDKKTILFAPLTMKDESRVHLSKKDNTVFYLKPENYGAEGFVAPIYERGFSGILASVETVWHAVDYVVSKSKALLDATANARADYAKEHKVQRIVEALRACKQHVNDEQSVLCESFARRKDVTVLDMQKAAVGLKANPGEDDKLAEKVLALTRAIQEEYPEDRLRDIGMLNGQEIFARLRSKGQPMLVDLEAGIESESPRALRVPAPQALRLVALDHKNTN